MKRLISLLLMLLTLGSATWIVWVLTTSFEVDHQLISEFSLETLPVEKFEVELEEAYGDELVDPFESARQANISATEMHGLLQMPTLGQTLPTYLGATYENLYSGTAIIAGSDLPSTQTEERVIIAGHRGYYGQILFLNLNLLRSGDPIYLYFNGQQYSYQVINQEVVEAHDVSSLARIEGRKLLTLLTCTPIPALNKRLLVHAELISVSSYLELPLANIGTDEFVEIDKTLESVGFTDEEEIATSLKVDDVPVNQVLKEREASEQHLFKILEQTNDRGLMHQRIQQWLVVQPYILVIFLVIIIWIIVRIIIEAFALWRRKSIK